MAAFEGEIVESKQYTSVKTEKNDSESTGISIKQENVEKDAEDDSRQSQSSSAVSKSLDVLAQVASNQLQLDPAKRQIAATGQPILKRRRGRQPNALKSINSWQLRKDKVLRKNPHHMDMLSLDQLRLLTDKVLVGLFAELTANELTRNYTFTCYLIPDKCRESFTSFGNENKAWSLVRSHLLQHIGKLLQLSTSKDSKNMDFKFEPLPALRKRLTVEIGVGRRNKKRSSAQCKDQLSEKEYSCGSLSGSQLNNRSCFSKSSDSDNQVSYGWSRDTATTLCSFDSEMPDMVKKDDDNDGCFAFGAQSEQASVSEDDGEMTAFVATDVSKRDALIVNQKPTSFITLTNEMEAGIEEMTTRQPFLDHSYTTIYGRRIATDFASLRSDGGSENDELEELKEKMAVTSRTNGMKNNYDRKEERQRRVGAPNVISMRVNPDTAPGVNAILIPMVRIERNPAGYFDRRNLLSNEMCLPKLQYDDHANQLNELKTTMLDGLGETGHLPLNEEATMSDDETSENNPCNDKLTSVSSVSERKLALKCIRELRCKRKEDTMLFCRICRNKSFTATATLMYHYRSHAGIKPFVCLICNTTFTRQHSLNYHMLIHNNQSRFTCKECGRKFRHPSHFKEHLRRHTGETPYHCNECPLRFKTRNTYKRHLKTRHGKLLTFDGVKHFPYNRMRNLQKFHSHEEDDDEFYNDEDAVCGENDETEDDGSVDFCGDTVASDAALSPSVYEASQFDIK